MKVSEDGGFLLRKKGKKGNFMFSFFKSHVKFVTQNDIKSEHSFLRDCLYLTDALFDDQRC